MRRLASILPALLAAPSLGATSAPCSGAPSPAGDWPTSGRSPTGSRAQPTESLPTPEVANSLAPAWTFCTGRPSGGAGAGLGDLRGTPVGAWFAADSAHRPPGAP